MFRNGLLVQQYQSGFGATLGLGLHGLGAEIKGPPPARPVLR